MRHVPEPEGRRGRRRPDTYYGVPPIHKPHWKWLIISYFFLGGLSAMIEMKLPGIVFQAAGATFGVFLSMLLLYTSRTIRATPALTRGIIVATCGVMVIYLISMAMSFFTGAPLQFIYSNGTFGIIFSLVVVGIAAFNLILDFDLVEQGAAAQAPKFMEWYAGFSLLVDYA